MLIRSQDKEMIINMAATNQIYVREVYLLSGSLLDIISDEMRLGHYSTKEKAMKVLDMIQEAYADAKLNEILLSDVCKAANESQMGKDNTLIAKNIRKDFMKKMIFQIPEDSEVEV